jgi:hypothetical protein
MIEKKQLSGNILFDNSVNSPQAIRRYQPILAVTDQRKFGIGQNMFLVELTGFTHLSTYARQKSKFFLTPFV